MYAVICTNFYYEEIETAVNTVESTVIYKVIGTNLNTSTEILKLRNVPLRNLIVDISAFDNAESIVVALKQLKLIKDNIRIIMFMPGYKKGDSILSYLINLGIYDIILPDETNSEEFILLPALIDVLNHPITFSKAHQILSNDSSIDVSSEHTKSRSQKVQIVEKVIEKKVEIEKEVIIGPIVIGVSGVINRIGTTHTVLSLASYLSSLYKVAVVELNSVNPVFLTIKNSYEADLDNDGSFFFNNIRFFPYHKDFNMLVLMNYDFDYIILDLGPYEQCNKNEFWRSSLRILLSGSKLWEISSLEMFFKEKENTRKDIVNYIFSFADDDTFKDIKKSLSPLKCYMAPYNPAVFYNSTSQSELYSELLNDFLPKKHNKRKGFFKR